MQSATYRERLSPFEGHPSATLLSSPLIAVLVVSNHNVLVETWIVMQSNTSVMAQIHVKPEGEQQTEEFSLQEEEPMEASLSITRLPRHRVVTIAGGVTRWPPQVSQISL